MLQRGKSPKYGNSNIQIIKSGQARGYRHLNFSKKYFVDTSFVLDKRKLEKGDILINSSGVGTAGRVTFFDLEGDLLVDSHISILRLDKEKAMPCYVLYAIANIDFKTIEAMATGQSGQIELSLTRIQNIKIPLPPKAIQEKIISEINVLEKKKVKAKETIRDLRNSIFLIIENSTKREKLVKLGDVTKIVSGGTPDTKNQDYWDGEINWATLRDTKNNYLYDTNKK